MALTKVGKEGITGISNSSDATAITIDSSENVLVGTTNTDPAFNNVAGQSMAASGQFQVTRDGGIPALINRKSDDGTILDVRKDGSTVGSIGAASGDLTIHGDVGIRFSGDDVRPLDSSGAQADNSVDLGHHDVRWQDLYLGGNLYIGGTGSANALDDYEEGTFTPIFQQGLTSAGYSSQEGTYVKIGSLVVCSVFLRANSGTENGDHIYVGGLPFTVITGTGIDHQYGAFFTYNGGFWSSDANTQWLARANETNLAFYKQADGGAIQGSTSGVATNLNADLRLVAVYRST